MEGDNLRLQVWSARCFPPGKWACGHRAAAQRAQWASTSHDPAGLRANRPYSSAVLCLSAKAHPFLCLDTQLDAMGFRIPVLYANRSTRPADGLSTPQYCGQHVPGCPASTIMASCQPFGQSINSLSQFVSLDGLPSQLQPLGRCSGPMLSSSCSRRQLPPDSGSSLSSSPIQDILSKALLISGRMLGS